MRKPFGAADRNIADERPHMILVVVYVHGAVPLGVVERHCTTPVPFIFWNVEETLGTFGGTFVPEGTFAFARASALGFASALPTFAVSLRPWDRAVPYRVRWTAASETCHALTASSL